MKVLAYKILLLSLLVLGISPNLNAKSGGKKYTKELKREFVLNGNGEVQLNNKYGRVEVRTWDKNRVKITVEIIVIAQNEAAAQKVFKKIAVDFKHDVNFVKAATSVNLQNSWWQWSENKLDYAVNYQIFMPASADLNLSNAYGEVYVSSLSGDVSLDLKYINFRIDALSGLVSANLQTSDGSIGFAKSMNLQMNSGSLTIKKVGNIEINSKSADINIEKANLIVSNSSYSSYTIGHVEEFHNDGKFDDLLLGVVIDCFIESLYSAVNLGDVKKYLIIELVNSTLEIKNLSKSFKEIKLLGKSSHFIISTEEGMPFELDLSAYNALVKYPAYISTVKSVSDFSQQEITARGNKKEKGGLIKVRMKEGSFMLKKVTTTQE